MKIQLHFSTSILLLMISFFSTTTSLAQHSPVQAPAAATPTVATTVPAASPGMSTVPLVPVSPGVAPTRAVPKGPTIDIVQILQKAKRFSVLIRLLKTTQLINQLNSQLVTSGSSGLTIFAPDDVAFGKLKAGFLNSISDRQKVELLQFHTLSSVISINNFDTLTNPVQTQAGSDPARLQLNVTSYGGSQVSMTTGAVNASVTGTVYADSKLAIYQVDKVLLPLDFVLPKAKAPAPAKADSPKSDKNKSSSKNGSGGDDGVSDSDDDGVHVDASSSSSSSSSSGFNERVVIMWVAFVAAAMV